MIEVSVQDQAWIADLPDAAGLAKAAAEATLAEVGGPRPGEVAILLTDDAAIRVLNARFRGQDRATNVLAFPAGLDVQNHAGDIALAHGVCVAEAAAQQKPLAHHLRHLIVHGVLHLYGFDHEDDAEAEVMEGMERRILASFGVTDPYGAEQDAEAGHV